MSPEHERLYLLLAKPKLSEEELKWLEAWLKASREESGWSEAQQVGA